MNSNPNPTSEEIRKSQADGKTLQARRHATTDRITSASETAPKPMQHQQALLAGAGILFIMLVVILVIVVL